MKQHITEEQLEELSDGAKSRLRDWWRSSYHILPIEYPTMNIGQMIEFLNEKGSFIIMVEDFHSHGAEKFCDNLWNQVKGVLEK